MTQIITHTGASFNRGRSKQDYWTPADFREAVLKRFGRIEYDLAASRDNVFAHHANCYYSEEEDSLTQSWSSDLAGLLWLNPPFGDIAPWAKKCSEEANLGAKILFLVPASVGSNWFCQYVHDEAMVLFLSPRISFDGKNPFPKDCLLACYNTTGIGYDCWRWKP